MNINNLKTPTPPSKRPPLTAETVVAYIDWILANLDRLNMQQVESHLRGAELVLRALGFEAQNKATQHTLVQEGVIAPPPPAPGG